MRKFLVVLVVLLTSFSLIAVTYDIGGGQTLVLNDDGTYEIVAAESDTSEIVGKQYKLEIERTIDPLIDLAIMEDPSIAALGRDFIYSLLEGMIESEIPEVSFVFLSQEKVLVTIEGEEPVEAEYRVAPDKSLFITAWDGTEEGLGTFSDDYGEIMISADGIPVYLVRQNS